MSIFRIWGVNVRIDFSFLVFLTLLFLMKNGAEIFSFFTVCLLHEAGHAAAVYLTGGRLSSLIFCGMGIKMIPERSKIFPLKSEILVLLAGPAVNLSAFVLFNSADSGNFFALLNLCAAVFNLMPYKLLDGGSVINLISEQTGCEKIVETILTAVRILIILITFYASLFCDKAVFPLFCAAVFYFATELR